MITKANFFIIIILVLVGVIVVQQCTSKEDSDKPLINVDGKNYELLKQKIDTVVIDHYKTKYVKGSDIYHETIVEKEKRVEVPVYLKGDTIRIVQEYNKKVLYKWFESAPYDLTLRIKSNKQGYITINVIKSGRLEIKYQWLENDKATYDDILEIIKIIDKLIEKINNEVNDYLYII